MELKLDSELVSQLKEYLNGLYLEVIEQSRRDAGISKEYLTIGEALKYTDVSRNTFTNNFIGRGLPTFQIEGKIYVKKSDINEFIEGHKI